MGSTWWEEVCMTKIDLNLIQVFRSGVSGFNNILTEQALVVWPRTQVILFSHLVSVSFRMISSHMTLCNKKWTRWLWALCYEGILVAHEGQRGTIYWSQLRSVRQAIGTKVRTLQRSLVEETYRVFHNIEFQMHCLKKLHADVRSWRVCTSEISGCVEIQVCDM